MRNVELPAGVKRLEAGLRDAVEGEVRFSDGDRAMYAFDASVYRQVPIGVVLPKSVAGTPNRKRIALTFVGDVLEESGYEASPAHVIPNPVGSAARKIFEAVSRKNE